MAINNQLLYKDDVGSVTIGDSKISSTFLSNNMVHLGGMTTIISPKNCTAGSYLNISLNSYIHTDSNYKYIHASESAQLQFLCGQALFRTAPAGVAGNNITYCEAMRINNEGAIGIGNYGYSQNLRTNQFFLSEYCSKAQIEGTGISTSSLQLIANSGGTGEYPILGFSRSRGTTIGSHTLVANDDYLGAISFFSSNGSSTFVQSAGIAARINNVCPASSIASNQFPTDLIFSINDGTANCGTSSVGRFSHGGNFLVGCDLACGNGMITGRDTIGNGVLEARAATDFNDGQGGVIVTRAVDCNSTHWANGCHRAFSHIFYTNQGDCLATCINSLGGVNVGLCLTTGTRVYAGTCVISPTICGSTLMKGCVICGYRTGTGIADQLRLERCDTVGNKTTCFRVSINPDNNCVVMYAACTGTAGILCSAQTFRAPVMYTNDCFCTAGCVYAAGVVYSPNCLCSPVAKITGNLIPSGITCCNSNIKTYTWPAIMCGSTSASCSYCYHLVRWSYDPFNWGNGGYMEFTLTEWYYGHKGGRKKYRVHTPGYVGGTGQATRLDLIDNTNKGGSSENYGIKIVGPTVTDGTAPGSEYIDIYVATRYYYAVQVQMETNAYCTTTNPPQNACMYICTNPTAQTDGTCFPICQVGSNSTECLCLGRSAFVCGLEICGGSANELSRHDATLYVTASTSNDWGIIVDKPNSGYLQKWVNCSNNCLGLIFNSCDGANSRTEFSSHATGITYSRVCFTSPIICGTCCVLAGCCVKSGIICGGSCVTTPMIEGTNIRATNYVCADDTCMGADWFRNVKTNSGLFNVANANHFTSTSACEWTICSAPNAVQLKLVGCKAATGCLTTGYLYGDATACTFGLLNCAHSWAVMVCPTRNVYVPCTICANITCGITCAISPIFCGTSCVKGVITCGVTCMISPIVCGTSCVTSPILCATTQVTAPQGYFSSATIPLVIVDPGVTAYYWCFPGDNDVYFQPSTTSTKTLSFRNSGTGSMNVCAEGCFKSPIVCGVTCVRSSVLCACTAAAGLGCTLVAQFSAVNTTPDPDDNHYMAVCIDPGANEVYLTSTGASSGGFCMLNRVHSTCLCGTSCVKGTITCGGTCVISPIVCGSSCVKGTITCGVNCVISTIVCGSSCIKGVITCGVNCVTSGTICATSTMQVGGNDVLTTASSVGANFCAGTDVNNRVVTANGASGSLCGEANMTFDGSTLNVTGAITASGDITSTSDERLKRNITAICGAIQLVNNLCGRYFIKDGREQVGVVAQEIEKILPQVVFQHNKDDDIRSVSYGNIVGVLIEAIKEQNTNMCNLQDKITDLEKLLGEK